MDVTVDLLIEVDKLIQLLESPIFICKYRKSLFFLNNIDMVNIFRLKNGAFGRTSESVFNPSTLWTFNDNASIGCISLIAA